MDWINVTTLMAILAWANIVLSSGIAITSFALLIYLILYNLRSPVARAFSALLVCVLIVFSGDLALFGVEDLNLAALWLRWQWLGIAVMPAAYLHLSMALLDTTGVSALWRRWTVRASYGFSMVLTALALLTGELVRGVVDVPRAPHLEAGPLFWLYTLYFLTTLVWGFINIAWARERCLTSTSRRRMTYLALASIAPAAGVFPFLLITGWQESLPSLGLWLLLIAGNVSVVLMLVLMAYSVAFFGVFTPDRVVKHRMVRFLLRGPFTATVVVLVLILASKSEGWLGLPSRQLMAAGAVAAILLSQVLIEEAKPLIDRLLYRRDRAEIDWLQGLSSRLLTSNDLHQFLENVLTALCDLLRTPSAFIAVLDNGSARLEVMCGSLIPGSSSELMQVWCEAVENQHTLVPHGQFFVWDGYWLVPLYARRHAAVLGVLGVVAREDEPDLSPVEVRGVGTLIAQAEAALEDRQIQQGMFGALEQIIPEIEDIQRRRGVIRYTGAPALVDFAPVLTDSPEFQQWVWDALSHYWGGPKLTGSPLLGLHVVERAAQAVGGSSVKALRTVLMRAIEGVKPEGQRRMTATEWILYNILELKFLQGRKVREIAAQLAMSESDLYRKQRVAIEEVARVLADMERQALAVDPQPAVGSAPDV